MSLLMDALRKAEADKKQARSAYPDPDPPPAAGVGSEAGPDVAVTREFQQDDTNGPGDRVAGGSPPADAAFGRSAETGKSATRGAELSLEPLAAADRAGVHPPVEVGPLDATLVGGQEATATMPGAETQLGSYFDESQSNSAPPSPAAATDEFTARDSGSGIRETVATAQTVFEVGARGPSKRTLLRGGIAVVVIACVMVGVGIYYFQQAPAAIQIPSPSVAIDVEKSPRKVLPTVSSEAPREPLPAAVTSLDPLPAVGAEADDGADMVAVNDPLPPAEVDAEVDAAVATTAEAPAVNADSVTLAAEPFVAEAAGRGGASVQHEIRTAPDPPQIGVRPGEVRIARSRRTADTGATLNQAYNAFVAGNYAEAGELYQRVLSQRPEQRDALLGAAALKLRNGDGAGAHRLYRAVLKRDPGNPTASAALFSLEGGSGKQVTESRLKMLLDAGADAGYIYFSLGNLYARHQRWADAQQAYFEALRNDPGNPDYNYNLAVGLDRLGQRAVAVKYYNAALDLSDGGPAGFDMARTLARIQAINGASSP